MILCRPSALQYQFPLTFFFPLVRRLKFHLWLHWVTELLNDTSGELRDIAQVINTDYEGEMLMDSTRMLWSHLATERKVEEKKEQSERETHTET